MWKLIFVTLIALATAEKVKYNNYQVFRVFCNTEEQYNFIKKFDDFSDGFSFWKEPNSVQKTADIMVAPHLIPDFHNSMRKSNISYELYVKNVQSLIDSEKSLVKSDSFNLENYHTLDEIYQFLKTLKDLNPDKVQILVGGSTYEGRQIKGVKLSFGGNKPGIFLEGGMHAREWISTATVLYILQELIYSSNPEVRALAESHDWYIFPVMNPDGYEYTHTTNRLWRKTRQPHGLFCYGADPNRNWGYKWMEGGASSNPCSETYAGSAPFSEIETKSMSDFITSISDKFSSYIAFHSYSQLLLFPYGHTKNHLDNYDESLKIGQKAIEVLSHRYRTLYQTGNIAEIIYVATGSSMDWVKGIFHKRITYTYELRDTGRFGFILPANQIAPTALETLDSLVAMFSEAKA